MEKKSSQRCRSLLSSIRIGQLEVTNRIVLAPMDTEFTAADGSVTDRYVAFLGERAAGGAGMILTEFSAVDAEQMMSSLGSYSGRLKAGLNRLVDAVAPWRSKLFLQLAHHGGQALVAMTGQRPVAPSEISCPLYTHVPRALSRDEILGLIEKFVEAGVRAKAAGFDGVEVHGAYDYLIGQFLSPHCNRRSDDFGGTFAGRTHFASAIIDGIRGRCGSEFPIGFKFSAYEDLPGGLSLEEGERIAQWAESRGVAYVHVAVTSSRVDLSNLSTLYSNSAEHEKIATRIRAKVHVPVIVTACSRTTDDAERLLTSGAADLVAVGRAFLADPAWGRSAVSGASPRPCILCNRCHQRIMNSRAIRCTVNPRLGEDEGTPSPPSCTPRDVTIVGCGPAGLAAAFAAAERGHRIRMFEKRDRVGGNLVFAAAHSFKHPMKELLMYYEAQLRRYPIDLRLQVDCSVGSLLAEPAAVIVVATGSRPLLPAIQGAEGAHIYQATHPSVLDAELPEEVVVVGAGLVGLETALHLAEHGRRVTVVEKLAQGDVLADEATYVRDHLMARLDECGVRLLFGQLLLGVAADHVTCLNPETGTRVDLRSDAVVLALGYVSDTTLYDDLRLRSPAAEVIAVGDCRQIGNLYSAIQNGHQIGCRI